MLIGVLALQGDVVEHRGALAELGAASRPVRLPEDLSGIDGLILPGGESTTMSMLLDSSGLREPLRKELDAGLPAFGTCAGLILLATTIVDGRSDQAGFGVMDLTVRRNAYGRQRQSFECDIRVGAVAGGPVHAVFIRAPWVEAVGPGVEVLATLAGPDPTLEPLGADARDRAVPVLVRQGRALAASFHPELTADRRVHQLFLSLCSFP
ncbi:MAG TPA: pyridoxal 5'-phosphate synthase glutaminase subunit PdxT [Acidimicrobiales bacterium]|nr:pyridoxal 5'-phosphate synthase glutaminase subunit PdxT [Acidimicrobiales bacterium]